MRVVQLYFVWRSRSRSCDQTLLSLNVFVMPIKSSRGVFVSCSHEQCWLMISGHYQIYFVPRSAIVLGSVNKKIIFRLYLDSCYLHKAVNTHRSPPAQLSAHNSVNTRRFFHPFVFSREIKLYLVVRNLYNSVNTLRFFQPPVPSFHSSSGSTVIKLLFA